MERYVRWLLVTDLSGRQKRGSEDPPLQRDASWRWWALVAALAILMAPEAVSAGNVQLTAETVAAFERYVRITDVRNDAELQRGAGWLWVDGFAKKERDESYGELKHGVVKIKKLETLDGGVAMACPGGLIHHWVGAIFIPGAGVDDVLRILRDYEHHASYYAPDVERSKLLARDGDKFRAFLRFRRKKIITVVLDTEHEVHYFRDAAGLAHSRSSAVRITEVENAGTADEREKKPGDDDGFMWKMETWWRVEAGDGGVYVQSEVVSLTRGIPAGLGWMIGPFVTSIPKESLTFTLEATRKAVLQNQKQ